MVSTGIIEINARCSDISFQACKSEVYIDDKFMGYTPIQLFLSAGGHTYKIIKPGYFPQSQSPPPLMAGVINVQHGLKSTLDIELISSTATGGISFDSSPGSAHLFIDDKDQKRTTPTMISGLAKGEHKYKITLPGYVSVEGKFNALLGEPIHIHPILEQLEDFGTVYIHPTPVLYGINIPYILQGANIYIDNVDTGKLMPSPITGLTKGVHTFRIKRLGTVDREGMFTINGGDTQLISIYPILEPKIGMLSIRLSPFIGEERFAHVYIDGKDTGSNSDIRYAIAEGTHAYRLYLEGYEDPEGKFEIVQNRITHITPHICRIGTPRQGTVNISSNPFGASIAIDDVYLGQYTPATTKHLPDGDYTYRLSKAGYLDASGTFTIINGSVVDLNPSLVQSDSILDISCNVIAAMVYIDNRTEGWTTPTEIIGLSPGAHIYRLVIPDTYGGGFDDATGTFNIEKGKTTRVDAVLYPTDQHTGNLIVNSVPIGARVFIDDIDTKSVTPHNIIDISSGIHKVRLILPGYKDWIGNVMIVSGSVVSILENLTQKKYNNY